MPSAVDPSLTDDATTVMTMFTQYGPHREEDWPEGAREAYAQRCLDIVAEHAPNVRDALVHYEVLAPPDLERIFGLAGGSIFQGEQGLDQMAFMRPSPLLAQYATPVDGLYLCGAGTHPGGGVMAACGHNAAQRILKDRRSRWPSAQGLDHVLGGWGGRVARGTRRAAAHCGRSPRLGDADRSKRGGGGRGGRDSGGED